MEANSKTPPSGLAVGSTVGNSEGSREGRGDTVPPTARLCECELQYEFPRTFSAVQYSTVNLALENIPQISYRVCTGRCMGSAYGL